MSITGITPFDSLSVLEIVMLGLVYSAAFLVKGVFGYGAVPVLILAGSFVVEPQQAVVLAAVTNLLTHAQYMGNGLRHGDKALTLRVGAFLLPTLAIGVYIFSKLDNQSLSVLAGAIILFSVMADWRGWLAPLAPWACRQQNFSDPLFGGITGLISGIVGAGSIAFLSIYLRLLVPERRAFRATIILATGLLLTSRSLMLTLAGMIDLTTVAEALLLLPGGLLAGWIGGRLSEQLGDRCYFAFYRWVLLLGAAMMMFRGLISG